MLPGSFISLAHISKQAFLNGENYSFYLVIQDEMSASIFVDSMAPGGGARGIAAAKAGDSEKNAIFKQLITDRWVYTCFLHRFTESDRR